MLNHILPFVGALPRCKGRVLLPKQIRSDLLEISDLVTSSNLYPQENIFTDIYFSLRKMKISIGPFLYCAIAHCTFCLGDLQFVNYQYRTFTCRTKDVILCTRSYSFTFVNYKKKLKNQLHLKIYCLLKTAGVLSTLARNNLYANVSLMK